MLARESDYEGAEKIKMKNIKKNSLSEEGWEEVEDGELGGVERVENKTSPYMTKYERARVLGKDRCRWCSMGFRLLISNRWGSEPWLGHRLPIRY